MPLPILVFSMLMPKNDLMFRRKTRYAHWYDVQYQKAYIPFYTNMGSFTFGMIAGLLYCKHKQGQIDLTKSKVCGKSDSIFFVFYFVCCCCSINLHSQRL